jgi:hypothetical protein
MAHHYRHHYTVEEARALLPEITRWLDRIKILQAELTRAHEAVAPVVESGADAGGRQVNRLVRGLAELKGVIAEFRQREILIKDVERGLIDFPAIIGGREVFLCWEQGEPDIEYWHDLDSGYAGRERL